MARKFGKKNVIQIDPFAYNMGLIGESGIGKSTIAKQYCEKLVGEDGYLMLSIGREDGHDAIANVITEKARDWAEFSDITKDIVSNITTDYKELKVVVYDTIDELVRIAEDEAIRLHNRSSSEKRIDSIKKAYGGFGKGEDKAIELILNKLWELKEVGISMFIIGHTKKRTMTDPVTEQSYDMLTTNITHKYFNAIKTKLHLLGVASIDREIKTINTGKDIMGKDTFKGIVNKELRKITFRDDNYSIDSKSRFSGIRDSVNFNVDDYISAITEAIELEHNKQTNKSSIAETKVSQEIEKEKKMDETIKNVKLDNERKKLEDILGKIKDSIIELKDTNPAKLKGFIPKLKALGYEFKDIEGMKSLDHAEQIMKLLV